MPNNVSNTAMDMKTALPEDVGISSERLARIDRFAQELIDNKKTGGIVILIARGGKVIYHKSFGFADIESGTKLTTDYLFRLRSMTKPIISVALLTLYEQGKFKLTDPLELYIPAFRDVKVFEGFDKNGNIILVEPKRKITIHDVFRHTAGFSYGIGKGPVDRAYQEAGITFRKLESLTELVEKLAKLPLLYHPGEEWVYSFAHDIQAYLVEYFSGMPFDKYCIEKIFKPLGMKDTVFGIPSDYVSRFPTVYGPAEKGDGVIPIEKSGDPGGYAYYTKHPFGGHSLSSTAMDYYKFGQMLLNKGEFNGVRILGKETVELMTSNHLPKEIPGIMTLGGVGYGLGVSYVFNVANSGNLGSIGIFGWGGSATTEFKADPKEDMVYLFFTQYIPTDFGFVSKFQNLVYQAIVNQQKRK
jgi:CubicO group peptidase (beta-lactamase class C family)